MRGERFWAMDNACSTRHHCRSSKKEKACTRPPRSVPLDSHRYDSARRRPPLPLRKNAFLGSFLPSLQAATSCVGGSTRNRNMRHRIRSQTERTNGAALYPSASSTTNLPDSGAKAPLSTGAQSPSRLSKSSIVAGGAGETTGCRTGGGAGACVVTCALMRQQQHHLGRCVIAICGLGRGIAII